LCAKRGLTPLPVVQVEHRAGRPPRGLKGVGKGGHEVVRALGSGYRLGVVGGETQHDVIVTTEGRLLDCVGNYFVHLDKRARRRLPADFADVLFSEGGAGDLGYHGDLRASLVGFFQHRDPGRPR